MHHSRWRALLPVYLCILLGFPAAMVALTLLPETDGTICAFRLYTHLDCPSCGMTRAFRALGRLDVAGAIRYNPVSPALLLGALALWGYAGGMLLTRGRLRLPAWWARHQGRILWVALALFLLAGFARMGYQLRHPPPLPRAPRSLPFRGLLPAAAPHGRPDMPR